MGARSKARKRALDTLFEAEARGLGLDGTLAERVSGAGSDGRPPVNDYTVTLVKGVVEHQARIDELLSTYAEWTLPRMPAVDRNVLRIGVFELLFTEDIPAAVAIDEAVSLVRQLSTDDSPSFVNGVLANISKDRATLAG